MCLQDLRIANYTTPQSRTVTGGADGFVAMPDLSLAYIIWGVYAGGDFYLLSSKVSGTDAAVPFDTRFQLPSSPGRVWSRESLGALIRGPLFAEVATGETATVFWLQTDTDTFGLINQPLR